MQWPTNTVIGANEAHQGRLGRTTHQTGRPFAAIEEKHSSALYPLTITSHHVKHIYDSDPLADSNQLVPKNLE